MELVVPPERLVDGDTAFFTFTTSGYAPFTKNLHASLMRASPYLASRLVVFCPDEETRASLESSGIFAISCDALGLPEFVSFESPGFGQVVSYKYAIALQLLSTCKYVWWCDGDIVALAPLLERIRSSMARYRCDLLTQYEWPKDVYNCGFWMARRCDAVERLLEAMVEYTTQGALDDQEFFNSYILEHRNLRVRALDYDEFMCGDRFYYRFFRRPDCFLMHFNYSVGKQTKEHLMKSHGVWYLSSSMTSRLKARTRHIVCTAATKAGIPNPEQKFDALLGLLHVR